MLLHLGYDETKVTVYGKYKRVLETCTYNIICWRHTIEGGYIDNVSENRLVNEDYISWINNLSEAKCPPQWRMSTIKIEKIKWYIMFIYANIDMQIDPLYKWVIGPSMNQVNTRGTAYLFRHSSTRNTCLDIFTNMVSASSGGILTSIPKIWITPIIVEDNITIRCKCGGQYKCNKWKRHRETSIHIEWMELCKELCVDEY